MTVRTYNPSVRVGNWNEDIQLEEDTLKDFLERKERGELLIQKTSNLKDSILNKIELSTARTGNVQFGQNVLLINPPPASHSRASAALSVHMSASAMYSSTGIGEPCGVTGSINVSPCARTVFTITSCDGSYNNEPLRYGQDFYLQTSSGNLFLESDRATFKQCAKKSRHNEIRLVPMPTHLAQWRVLSFDPQIRLEMEGLPVKANGKVVLSHVKTNQSLCLESDHLISTSFGKEFEISGCTRLDSHKAEEDVNHWMFVLNVPGDPMMPVSPPKDAPQPLAEPAAPDACN